MLDSVVATDSGRSVNCDALDLRLAESPCEAIALCVQRTQETQYAPDVPVGRTGDVAGVFESQLADATRVPLHDLEDLFGGNRLKHYRGAGSEAVEVVRMALPRAEVARDEHQCTAAGQLLED